MEKEKNGMTNMNEMQSESQPMTPEMVNHPQHYNNYNIEVIDMMERIWGPKMVAVWCLLTSFKYRMRMGTKPGENVQRDLDKEKWYLDKYQELIAKIEKQ